MAGESKDFNPGSALGDFVEEWKKAPPVGKLAIVGVVVVVIGVAIYMRKKAGTSSNATPAQGLTAGGASNNGTGGGGGGGSTMPTPTPAPVSPGNPTQPAPPPAPKPMQGGGNPPRGTPIPQKPIAKPVHGAPPPPRPLIARSPQSSYKQPAKAPVYRPIVAPPTLAPGQYNIGGRKYY